MSILVNKNTTGSPMTTTGRTGTQVVKFIPAPRVYVKPVDSIANAPTGNYILMSNGHTPNGWQDLGIVSDVKLTYNKQTQEVNTGMDNYLRAAYVKSKACSIEFKADQFDDVNIELLTGFTPTIISDKSVNYQIGQEDFVQKAILVIFQNKLDGKEMQFYNPNAYLKFTFDSSNDAMQLGISGILPSFTGIGQVAESFLSLTEYVLGATSVVPPDPTIPNHLALADTATNVISSFYFSYGTAQIGTSGGDSTGQVIKLTDITTQVVYLLQISNGTLIAVPTSDTSNSVASIKLVDVLSNYVYTISIASGALVIS